MPVGHLGMTASLAQKTRFELRGGLGSDCGFPSRELDHGSPRKSARERARNQVVQVRCFGGPDGLEVVDAPLPRAERSGARCECASALGLAVHDVVIRRRSTRKRCAAGAVCAGL